MTALVVLGFACDEFGLSPHARAARHVLDATGLPAAFSPMGLRYSGNTLDVPIRSFTAPPGSRLAASAFEVPAGFRRDLGEEVDLREDHPPGRNWHLVGYWVGASPIESGICTVIVSSTDRSEVETRIEVEVACVLD